MALDVESSNSLTFQNYEIVITEGKYGIVNPNREYVIECVFDEIEWFPNENLVKFRLGGKFAVCLISDIEKFEIFK